MSRLGLVSAGEANVSVLSRSRPVTYRAHPWSIVVCSRGSKTDDAEWLIETLTRSAKVA